MIAAMRFTGLLVLAIFFPALVHAAPPSLTTYTVSHDTIYPGATADSDFATTTSIDTAFSEQVKVSIKIVSSSGAAIKSLYSESSVTNPKPKIWDGTNTAGARTDNGAYTILISATSTATSLTMTDSSKTITVASSDATPPGASSSATTTAATTSGGAPPEYIPIPTLHISTDGDRTVSAGADTAFSAVVYDGKGNKRDDALILWSFGDGMQRTGASVFHAYYDPGEYVAVVHASTPDGGDALATSIVTAKDASIQIVSVSARGIALINKSPRALDLSLWRLSMGGKEFKIPANTHILASHTILFPSQIIQLPIASTASLLYPSGEMAATYPETVSLGPALSADRQPFVPQMSSNVVQTVEPAPSTSISGVAHDVTAVAAPVATTELAAAGAALPPALSTSTETVSTAHGPLSRIFRSPWTLGFLGLVTLAGAAFIFL